MLLNFSFYNPTKIYFGKNSLDKFVRFGTEIWGVSAEGKTKQVIAEEGINAMENFLKECGIVTNLKDLGATKEMLPKIAESAVITGRGYKKLNRDEILKILEACF
nr:iron-containing alcohol dehydrogenase [uncultured Desulfobacter sp.]